MSTSLVIDADIIHSATFSSLQRPKLCRAFLEATRKYGHRFVLTDEILEEWERHFRDWSQIWFTDMIQRGQVRSVSCTRNNSIRDLIERNADNEGSRRIMQKDVHMIEAALLTDKRVASMDKRARLHFGRACAYIKEIQDVLWVNPEINEENCVVWLEQGAPPEEHRQLGYQHREH